MRGETKTMLDLVDPDHGVQLQISPEGDKVWVNVDGICRMRVQGLLPGMLEICDMREETK